LQFGENNSDKFSDLCLGEAFGALDAKEYHTFIRSALLLLLLVETKSASSRDLFESIKLMGVLRFMINYPALGVIFKLLVKLKPSITQRRAKSHALSEGKLKRRLEMDVDRKDFLAYARPPHSIPPSLPISPHSLSSSIRILPC
jgi:hypothetical protein